MREGVAHLLREVIAEARQRLLGRGAGAVCRAPRAEADAGSLAEREAAAVGGSDSDSHGDSSL